MIKTSLFNRAVDTLHELSKDKDLVCSYTESISYNDIKALEKSKQKFAIEKVEHIFIEGFPIIKKGMLGLKGKSKEGKLFNFDDSSGVFKFTLKDESIFYMIKWFSGNGRTRDLETIIGANYDTWKKIYQLRKAASTHQQKPKFGIYTIDHDKTIVIYNKVKKYPNNPIYHDMLPVIKNDVNDYFSRVSDFMKYNQPGRRSILLYGEPGTSKTSTLYELAREHSNSKCIVVATSVTPMYLHIKLCEKYQIPTIVVFEDCESALSGNNADVKNFLSGTNAGHNKQGTYIIYTTNYPESIEETIIERPERIDKLFHIGPIVGEMLIKCAKFYFGEFSPNEEELRKIFTKAMTGAEVKDIAQRAMAYCASHNCNISSEIIQQMLTASREDIQKLKKFKEGKTTKTYMKNSQEREPFGFNKQKSKSVWETMDD